MAILREHLIEKVPISEVCEKHGLQPTVFYGWQKKLFEEGATIRMPAGESHQGAVPGRGRTDAVGLSRKCGPAAA